MLKRRFGETLDSVADETILENHRVILTERERIVLGALKNSKKPISVAQLRIITGYSIGRIYEALAVLREMKLVKTQYVSRRNAGGYANRISLYLYSKQ